MNMLQCGGVTTQRSVFSPHVKYKFIAETNVVASKSQPRLHSGEGCDADQVRPSVEATNLFLTTGPVHSPYTWPDRLLAAAQTIAM